MFFRFDLFYSSCKDRLLYWVKKVEQFAKAGNSDFQHKIGDYYYNGTGVRKNKNTALRWYIKAYENGLKDTWREIVQCYFDKNNEEQVFIWTERAANDGCVDAYIDLGQLYMKQDDKKLGREMNIVNDNNNL